MRITIEHKENENVVMFFVGDTVDAIYCLKKGNMVYRLYLVDMPSPPSPPIETTVVNSWSTNDDYYHVIGKSLRCILRRENAKIERNLQQR